MSQKAGFSERVVRFSALWVSVALAGCGVGGEELEGAEPLGVAESGLNDPIPSGFFQIASGTGIRVFRKNYTGGQPDFVAVVDLRSASVRNLSGTVSGAPNGVVSRKSLSTFWTDARAFNTTARTARVVINAAFFSTNDNPTGIAFGLKQNGGVVSYGYGLGEFPTFNRTFSFNVGASTAAIGVYNRATFDGTTFPDVVGGLDPAANKSATSYVPRTFVGVRDTDRNGVIDTVLTYSSAFARQVDATNVLNAFGSSANIMMDGGGSTGLIIDGTSYITPGRTVPHALAFYAGK